MPLTPLPGHHLQPGHAPLPGQDGGQEAEETQAQADSQHYGEDGVSVLIVLTDPAGYFCAGLIGAGEDGEGGGVGRCGQEDCQGDEDDDNVDTSVEQVNISSDMR